MGSEISLVFGGSASTINIYSEDAFRLHSVDAKGHFTCILRFPGLILCAFYGYQVSFSLLFAIR